MTTMMSINEWLHKQPSSFINLTSGRVGFWFSVALAWTYKGRNIYMWQTCTCTHAPCAKWTERRRLAEAGEMGPPLPAGSRTITYPLTLWPTPTQFKYINTFRETNPPSARLLTFPKCSEVNSLNRHNKRVQLAVVSPQLKNRIFGRIASFSTRSGGGGEQKDEGFYCSSSKSL